MGKYGKGKAKKMVLRKEEEDVLDGMPATLLQTAMIQYEAHRANDV